ncbi:MAG: DUF2339 domain-containing protein [Hyphomicrobiales bacterium]|nr:DUF2339 domain-containing protein [Hyphomicrobiales bacterium]
MPSNIDERTSPPMDFLPLLILAVLALPVAAIAALVMALRNRGQLNRLEARIVEFERRLGQVSLRQDGVFGTPASAAAEPAAPAAEEEIAEPVSEPEAVVSPEPEPVGSPPQEPVSEDEPVPATETAAAARVVAEATGTKKDRRSFEETIGTRWTVWVGGLALALGGVFLVRFAIEQGLLGPAARIALGGLFSALLLALGEWTRRNERQKDVFGFDAANIPGALTAAGTVAAFATVYAAHALYGFIGPGVAFVALGVVSVATMVLAALHAPWLAGLGLVGAFATPVLVSSDEPQAAALFSFLIAVSFAALWLARMRHWRWLAIAAIAGAIGWGIAYLDFVGWSDYDALAFALYVAAGAALTGFFLVHDVHRHASADTDIWPDWLALAGLAGYALLCFGALQAEDYGANSLALLAVLTVACLALAWRYPAVMFGTAIAGGLVAVAYFGWPAGSFAVPPETVAPELEGLPRLRNADYTNYLAVGLAYAVLFLAAGVFAAWRALRSGRVIAGLWATITSVAVIALLVIAYYRVTDFERSMPFAAAALIVSVAAAMVFEAIVRRERREAFRLPSLAGTAYAVAAIASFALALTIALEKGWLTIALAATAAGTAWIWRVRPVGAMPPLSVALLIVVLGRMFWDPAIVGNDLGTTPVLNWLLYGYGVPTLAAAYAAWTYGRARQTLWVRMLQALGIVFAAMLAVFEIRHFIHDGDVLAESTNLVEQSLMTVVALAFAIGLDRIHRLNASPVFANATLLFGAAGFVVIIVSHFFFYNPLVSGDPVGTGVIFNDLLLGYAIPALLAAILHLVTRNTRPATYVAAAGGLSLALAFAYLSLMVRHVFQGEYLDMFRHTGDPELYTYSVVWLVFGIVLLFAGIWSASRPMRLASAAVILATVLKVFFVDMEGLTGVWRALSFIGLGAVLIAIGAFYQRLLFPAKRRGEEESGEAAPS